jgi:murein DD-endopeptidase MepM/ murein hydrolase activator NlpD
VRTEVALADVQPAGAPVAPPTWTRLVTIERSLVGQQDELGAQEAAIARLAVNVAGSAPDDEDSLQVGPDSRTQLRNRLTQLVAAHTATQTRYQQSLQAEYDLYRAAAQNPTQREQLTAAALAAQQPQAKEAITYNLSLVQTQLSQEAVIAQAERQLAQLGSLGAAQLDAMRHHQAFIAPMVAPVTQTFGPTDFSLEPPLNYNGTFSPHFHTGLDLGAPLDTPIHAAADGVVLLAAASVDETGKLVGYGNYVVIAHPDGFVTLYGHLNSTAVKAGQVVHQGEIVGQEGSTGWSTGPHVHFEIRHNGQFLDPAPFLAGQLPPS